MLLLGDIGGVDTARETEMGDNGRGRILHCWNGRTMGGVWEREGRSVLLGEVVKRSILRRNCSVWLLNLVSTVSCGFSYRHPFHCAVVFGQYLRLVLGLCFVVSEEPQCFRDGFGNWYGVLMHATES